MGALDSELSGLQLFWSKYLKGRNLLVSFFK